MRKGFLSLVGIAAFTVIVLMSVMRFAAVSSASAANPQSPQAGLYYNIVNRNSNMSLDVFKGMGYRRDPALQQPYHGGLSQQWSFVRSGPYFQIVNRNSGQVLEVDPSNSQKAKGNLVMQEYNFSSPNQQWSLVHQGNYNEIVNVASGEALDVVGGGKNAGISIVQWPYHGGYSQQWSFTAVNPYYKIVNSKTGQVLDIVGGGKNAGARVVQWPYHGGYSQQWLLVPYGPLGVSGQRPVRIVNRNSGLVLDVSGGGKNVGAQVIQWQNHNGANQQWFVMSNYGEVYGHSWIQNVNSSLVLNVFGNGKTTGANVIQSQGFYATATEAWDLIAV